MTDKPSYLNFIAEVVAGTTIYHIVNDKQEHIGALEKVRVGQWYSWCLFLNDGCYASASCLDEIREKIRRLNNNKLVAL
jgi:hypothetical protein